jgi:hypothetical protein
MRYSPSTLQFVWLGRKLFGGRFIRFMSGPKNESDILTGSSTPIIPSCTNLKNFNIIIACPFSQHQKVCQEHLEKLQLLKLLTSG